MRSVFSHSAPLPDHAYPTTFIVFALVRGYRSLFISFDRRRAGRRFICILANQLARVCKVHSLLAILFFFSLCVDEYLFYRRLFRYEI